MRDLSDKTATFKPRSTVLDGVYATALAIWMLLSMRYFWGHIGDDSYIFFRYAHHVVDGNGLQWNANGVPVEGFSSPLWVMWLAVFGRWFDVVVVAKATGALCLMGALGELYRQSRNSIEGLWVLSLLMGVQYWSTSGLETPLYMWLLLVVVPLMQPNEGADEKVQWRWWCLGLLGLVRPESPAMVLLVLFVRWWQSRQMVHPNQSWLPNGIISTLSLSVAPMLCWQLFRMLYYDDILPNTYWAKASGDLWVRIQSGWNYAGWLLVPLLVGLWKSSVRPTYGLPVALWLIVLFGGGDWMWHHRLLVPVFALVILLVAESERWWRFGVYAWMSVYFMTPATVSNIVQSVWTQKSLPIVEYQEGNLIEVSENLAQGIRSAYPKGSVIAVNHAGALPYFLMEYEFVDMSALNDRYLAKLSGNLHAKYDAEHVLSFKPDVVILNSFSDPKRESYKANYWVGETALFEHPDFSRTYVPIAQSWRRVRHGGGIASIWVFQRRKGL